MGSAKSQIVKTEGWGKISKFEREGTVTLRQKFGGLLLLRMRSAQRTAPQYQMVNRLTAIGTKRE